MKTERFVILMALAVAFLFLVSADDSCTPDPAEPPFDATGEYEGTWNSEFNPTECTLYATLEQDVDADYPNDHVVTGDVVFDLSCINALGWWAPPIDPVEFAIYGTMTDSGELVMAGVGYGSYFGIEADLNGSCTDDDSDGQVDLWAGDISVRILDVSNNPYIARHGDFELYIQ